jgi:hypothetical protein
MVRPRPRASIGPLSFALAAGAVAGCVPQVAAPPSAPPNADAALARMHAAFACGNAIQGNGPLDQYVIIGRVRTQAMLFAARPGRLRLDIVSPFGVALATLTTNDERFALADLRDKRFLVGPSAPCNIARLTQVPVPAYVLVELLRGEAPVLKHDGAQATMAWDSHGYWTVSIASSRDAHEEIHLAPRPEDWARPWDQQRLRVLDVRVVQQGFELYHAELAGHAPAPTSGPRVDPDNLAPPIPPSGPTCDAEIPRSIELHVQDPKADLRLQYDQVVWNPALPEGTFDQGPPPGMRPEEVLCE